MGRSRREGHHPPLAVVPVRYGLSSLSDAPHAVLHWAVGRSVGRQQSLLAMPLSLLVAVVGMRLLLPLLARLLLAHRTSAHTATACLSCTEARHSSLSLERLLTVPDTVANSAYPRSQRT